MNGIGIAAPGPLDPFEGVIIEAPNVPGWVDLSLCQIIQDSFNVPVALGNDANLAALGEWKFGAGKGHHNLIYLTVSTGIGGGVIVDDNLLIGEHGLAAELGHITVQKGGPKCGCGQSGHLEALASGTAITHWVKKQLASGTSSVLADIKNLDGAKISEAARSGDKLAAAAFEKAGAYIGRALADLLHIFNPTIVIIGGGVSQSWDFIIEPIWKKLEERVMTPNYLDDLVITRAGLSDNSGLMGALALIRSMDSSQE